MPGWQPQIIVQCEPFFPLLDRAVILSLGQFSLPENIWKYLETFLSITAGKSVLLASSQGCC